MKSMTFRQIIKKVWTKWLGKQSIDKQLIMEHLYRLPQQRH